MEVWTLGMNHVEMSLEPDEVRLIMKALDELRYSEASRTMTGSMLVNLAGLSSEWRTLTQQIARHEEYNHEPACYKTKGNALYGREVMK